MKSIEEVNNETNLGVIKLLLPSLSTFPSVSIIVPTCNRPNFYSCIIRNWEVIDYPREKLEMIVLDDSDIKNPLKYNGIKYYYSKRKMTIGEKRSTLVKLAKNDYIVHMDDDDWYPPESVITRIRALKYFGDDYIFGCPKTLCYDLINGQMFESYDETTSNLPITISESSMAYSRNINSKWDIKSTVAECIPFIKDMKVCTTHSSFIVTQFSHNKNTVNRRVKKSILSAQNAKLFESNMTMYDIKIFNDVRASIISELPEYRKAISFIKEAYDSKNIKTLYSNLPQKLKSNRLVIEFIREALIEKKTSTGKDIVYYCGPGNYLNSMHEWNPDDALGGSEEAVVNLSKQLVKRGYNVVVYCVLKGSSKTYNGVLYKPYYEWIPKEKQDITIIWRDPSNCEGINSSRVVLDLHDALVCEMPKNVTIMTKSYFHKKICGGTHVVPNGINKLKQIDKDENMIICTSSPDRCIIGLINAIKIIREYKKDAKLYWAYGFNDKLDEKWVKEVENMIPEGFINLGRVKDIDKLYERAKYFFYPTKFPEIDCISLSKAISAGCIPIVSPSGALSEKMGYNEDISILINDNIDYSLSSGDIFNNMIDCIINDKTVKTNYTPLTWDEVCEEWVKIFNC